MTTSFPAALDGFTNPTGSQPVSSPSHSGLHSNANDALAALEAKVGVDSSAVTTSLDYLVKSASNPGHTHTLYVPLSTGTTKGDILVHNGTTFVRRAVGTDGQFLVADSTQTDGVKWSLPSLRDVFARPVQWGSIHPNNTGTSIQGLGPGGAGAAATTSGTAAQQSDAEGVGLRNPTGTTSGNTSVVDSGSVNSLNPANLYDILFKFRVNTSATVRYFFGVTGNAAATEVGADTPAAAHRIGLTFSTSRPDTNWQFVRGANAWTLDDSGIAFATGIWYFRITWASTSSVTLKLYNSAGTSQVSRTYTTGLPTSSGRIMTGVATLTTAAASYDHYFVQWTMPAPVLLA